MDVRSLEFVSTRFRVVGTMDDSRFDLEGCNFQRFRVVVYIS